MKELGVYNHIPSFLYVILLFFRKFRIDVANKNFFKRMTFYVKGVLFRFFKNFPV